MKVAVESIGSYTRKLSITFPAQQVKRELDSAFKKMMRNARLPGFRRGKVPRKVLEARFGDEIRVDVANRLISQGYGRAVEEQEIEPVGEPSLTEAGQVEGDRDFTFTVTVDVKPQIELVKVEGLEVVVPELVITDEQVEAQIAKQLEREARLVEITDRPSQKGDMVMVELRITDGDDVVHEAPGTMVNLTEDPYYAGLEGFLEGLDVGAEKEGEVSFAESCQTEELAGKTLQVKAKVLAIQANQVPPLDDAFAEKQGYPSVDAYREAVREELRKQQEPIHKNMARAQTLVALIEANPFEIPDALVNDALKMLLQELFHQRIQMGLDPKQIGFSDAELADLRNRAQFAAKAGLLIERVREQQGLGITEEEFEKRIEEMAEERGQSIEAVRAFFRAPHNRADLEERMLEEKTIDWLLERAQVRPPTEEEKTRDAQGGTDAQDAGAADDGAREVVVADEASSDGEAPAPEDGVDGASVEAGPEAGDFSFLEGSVAKVKEALQTGAYDAVLEAILAAEKAGKARKGAIAAIQKRIAELA